MPTAGLIGMPGKGTGKGTGMGTGKKKLLNGSPPTRLGRTAAGAGEQMQF